MYCSIGRFVDVKLSKAVSKCSRLTSRNDMSLR